MSQTDQTLPTTAWKIEDRATWQAALAAGSYAGSALDRADGFIHLSTAGQVRETALKWFAGRTDLVLAQVDLVALGDTVKFEASRGGALFPHVYGPLPAAAVLDTHDMPPDGQGGFVFPEAIP